MAQLVPLRLARPGCVAMLREHGIVEDQQTQTIALVVKDIGLVDAAALHAEHIE